jgi:hypothetical protein
VIPKSATADASPAVPKNKPAKTDGLNEGLIGRWTFDDAANPGRNSISKNLPARMEKSPRTVAGVFGKAIALTPADTTGVRISLPPEVIPEGFKQFTFSVWVAPRPYGEYATLLRKEDVGRHGENRLLFAFQNGNRYLTLGINCGGNYAECDALVSPEDIYDGAWHLAAASFDGRMMRVFLDGREIGSFRRQAPLNTIHDFAPLATWRDEIANSRYETLENATVPSAPVFVGSSGGKGEFFDGKMDDLRIYSRALDDDEISALYASGQQEPFPIVLQARQRAASLYQNAGTFIKSLVATDNKIRQAGILNAPDAPTAVELQRLLRLDYPEETNAYIMKWDRNPVGNLLLDESGRIALAEKLAPAAFEYLPLTPMQWDVLPAKDRAMWERVGEIHSQFDHSVYFWKGSKAQPADASVPYENETSAGLPVSILYELENLVEERPRHNEAVAPYVTPATPATLQRTPAEARKLIEEEWLYQCDGHPTVGRTLQEIKWTRKLITRLKIEDATVPASLDKFEQQAYAQNPDSTDIDLYFAVRTLKRDIMFRNPVLDFNSLVYIDNPFPQGSESEHETRHRLGYQAVPGGRLIVQHGLQPDSPVTCLMPSLPLHGTFWRPDLSYDGRRVLFSFKPHNEKTFHIYEIGIDGQGLRQLTGGIFDDLDPIYLPDDKNIMFLTTRGHIYVRCMPPTNAFVMARMPLDTKPGDRNLYIVSRSGEPEYTPSVLHDGRVIYTRWEYTDKPLWRAQSLWTMQQNGAMVQTFWGNQSVWPDLLKDARQIPGSDKVMFTGSAHHNWFSGTVGIISPSQGFNFPDGLTKVTADVEWPECGRAPVDPRESEDYHASGEYSAYYSPYPLSEKDFIVSASRKKQRKFVLLLMDTDGNREIINEGAFNIWDAQPVRARTAPPVKPDPIIWPTWEERDNPQPGILYSSNVYEGASDSLRGKAKYLRILSIEHKTYTYWFKRNYVSSGPEISANQSEGVKKIIGTVPVEDDGSVNFTAPSGLALHFQLLDENQRALQTMRSFTGVQPGESRGCFGCHESHTRTMPNTQMAKAIKRRPSGITPVPWKDISVSYERYVQPALDAHCAKCHQDPAQPAYRKFNATLRPGFLGFKEPYMTLLGSPTWGSPYKNRENTCGGFGWADVIMVEAFGTVDSAAYITPPPMTRLSYKSRLVDLMSSGKHHGVKVDPENLLRVILWVDALGPYYGTEELRQMEDPIFQGKGWLSQPPRVQSAPIVQRPGPFDPFETDDAYDAPAEANYNKLPVCVIE